MRQIHFLNSLLDGKREISNEEIGSRAAALFLEALRCPCAVACVSPYYTVAEYAQKDEVIGQYSDYICRLLDQKEIAAYCLTDSYDNFRILLPVRGGHSEESELDSLFIWLREKLYRHFGFDLFIGVGEAVAAPDLIPQSASTAMAMLAYKYQFADRGVISTVNAAQMKHFSLFGEDIYLGRVVGRFLDGDLEMMGRRLDEMTEAVLSRKDVADKAVNRAYIEIAVKILNEAEDLGAKVEESLGDLDLYKWILSRDDTKTLKEWMLDLARHLMDQIRQAQGSSQTRIIDRAVNYVDKNLERPSLGLMEVSRAVGLSSAYFSQLFKKETGRGLNQYITALRLKRAREYLRESDMRCEDIAARLGFSSPSYFGRVFKQYEGLSPALYRKKR